MDAVSLTHPLGGVALVELARPDARNALDVEMVAALERALGAAGRDPEVRVVLLAGRGDTFCAGASRELLRSLAKAEVAPVELRLPKLLLDLPVPVIAAMEGHAVGGGLALGMSADVVLLSRESRYGFNFLDLGFTPGMGTTRLLEHVLPPALAHELLYTGELRCGRDFEGRGAVSHVLPRAEVRPKALDLAARIADKPRSALSLLKRTLSLPRRRAFEESLTLESLMHEVCFADEALVERIEGEYVE